MSKNRSPELKPGCQSLQGEMEDFLGIKDNLLLPPVDCYVDPAQRGQQQVELTQRTANLRFIIALLPDPVHTHSPVLFDDLAVAVQEGAQDEKYEFDGSWMPWEEETPYTRYVDDKLSDAERELKEDQPGIILFRRAIDWRIELCPPGEKCDEMCEKKHEQQRAEGLQRRKQYQAEWEGGNKLGKSYRDGLVVFVVGEDATHGIHKEQFRNAVKWIAELKPAAKAGAEPNVNRKRWAILGTTFSGSLPSLAQILSEKDVKSTLETEANQGARLAVYSGGVSGSDAAEAFQGTVESQVVFHSFLQTDKRTLNLFCTYLKNGQYGFDARRIAVISEDETEYGREPVRGETSGDDQNNTEEDVDESCGGKILKLYYPRDISALRAAYQTKALFDGGATAQPSDAQRR
ncbi:MAG: hypothetical protein ABSG69_14895, partial [Candidatus Acidiferrum sp.]